jgi:PAS domain S-box-containing protein
MEERAKTILNNLAYNCEFGILVGDKESLSHLLDGVIREKDVIYSEILDKGKRIIVRSGEKQIIPYKEYTCSVVSKQIVHIEDELFMDKELKPDQDEVIGYVRLFVSLSGLLDKTIQIKKTIFSILIIIILISILTAFLGTKFLISRPLEPLLAGTKKISSGDLSHRVKMISKDEIGDLAVSFNNMIEDLEKSRNTILTAKDYTDNIIKSMIDILIVIDPDGIIKTINIAALNLLGYEEKEIINKPMSILFEKESSKKTSNIIFNDKAMKELIKNGSISNYEIECLTKSGKKIQVIINGSVLYDQLERITGIVCIFRDITVLKRAEQAVRDSEQKLRAIIEHTEDVIFIKDARDRYLLINPSGCRYFGHSENEIIGKKDNDILDSNYLSRIRESDLHVRNTRKPYSYENHKIIDSIEKNFLMIKFPYFSPTGESLGIVCIGRDITHQKENEKKISESLKEKEILLKEIHHRVKNNLQIISSLLNLQTQYIKGKKILDLFQESQNRIKSMALIHEKLYSSEDLAKINFPEYIHNLADDLYNSYTIDPGNIFIDVSVDNIAIGIDLAVPCGLIINELVSNALKYAFPPEHTGKGIIKIKFHSLNSNNIELIVSDNGIGMPKNFDFKNIKTLGLHLVTLLVEKQLEGNLQLIKRHGTKFKINFKV